MPDPFVMGKGASTVLALLLSVAGAAQFVSSALGGEMNVTGSVTITDTRSPMLDIVWALSLVLGGTMAAFSYYKKLDIDTADYFEAVGLFFLASGLLVLLIVLAMSGSESLVTWAFTIASVVNFSGRGFLVARRGLTYSRGRR